MFSIAIKFTKEEGGINIDVKEVGDNFQIQVIDNGVGIPKERLNELFEIIQNTSTKGANKEEGTGLRLVLCKEFVEKNGGRLKIESEEGKGTTVLLNLPIS